MKQKINPSSIARIISSLGEPCGTGFLVERRFMVTCSHVIQGSLKLSHDSEVKPGTEVFVDFPFIEPKEKIKANITFWSLPSVMDVAVLEIERIPQGVSNLALIASDNLWNHSFMSFGFPLGYTDIGIWIEGKLKAPIASGLITMESANKKLGRGFGGSPVFDQDINGIVGMIVSVDTGIDTAFMLPSIELSKIIKMLKHEAIEDNNEKESNKGEITIGNFLKEVVKIIQLGDDATETCAINDKPIDKKQDDILDFSVYISALRDFITSQDTHTPLTISIDSPWGMGKTSLMRMLQRELDPITDSTLSCREKFKQIAAWIYWIIKYFLTYPIWILGKLPYIKTKIRALTNGLISDVISDFTENNSKVERSLIHRIIILIWVKVWILHHDNSNFSSFPTVWFNAWKFDQEEQLWAALALEVMDQLKNRYGLFRRLIFWLQLAIKRFSFVNSLGTIAKVMLWLFVLLSVWQYDYLSKLSIIVTIKELLPTNLTPILNDFVKLLLGGGLLFTAMSQAYKIVKDPFQIPVDKLLEKPNYADKIGFIGSFERDFERIVSVATKPIFGKKSQKLVIFIDDLDRCEPPKAADIIESINLFLDSEGCVFVIGMDSNAVAASIEIKYKELMEKTKSESIGMVSPGMLFLDKIIQIPFKMPILTYKSMTALVEKIINAKSEQFSTTEDHQNAANYKPTTNDLNPGVSKSNRKKVEQKEKKIDIASYNNEYVTRAIKLGAQFLERNPRQVKRFVNLFRLQIYIANSRGLFNKYKIADNEFGITIELISIWIALSLRWPNLIRRLLDPPQLAELRQFLLRISNSLDSEGKWMINHDENRQGPYESLLEELVAKQKELSSSTSQWYTLPWEWWLKDPDFMKVVKMLECFWKDPSACEDDWLNNLLQMNIST
jgi:hypothetical protein